ncbi:MAG TPA: class I SAM-dependent methyltransferase [Thermoanaerobaculia bacterium]|nr:class I SAM-dependent methyltransferase [Thermoanaerobaculia bacterium]
MAVIEQVRAYYNAVLPFYDLALQDRGDLAFWSAMARRWNSKRILEFGCGTGRVTTVLSEQAQTTAVDLMLEMLQRAARRAPRAQFVAADLRELPFASTFDLVVLADDPLAHVTSSEERAKVLAWIADHLAAGGRLVLEGLYRAPGRTVLVPPREIVNDGELLFTVEESWEPAGANALWNARYRFTTGSVTTEVATTLRSWTSEEIRRLPESGLQVEQLWGDFDERPFTAMSPGVVIVASGRGQVETETDDTSL